MKTKIKMEKVFSYKTLSWGMIVLFLLSLFPILYCSFFDYATGDDLWEGAAAYQILQQGGTLRELFSAVFSWMKMDYLGWQGNWSSTFLWCFSPNVFGEKAYCITPWIGLCSICAGHWYCFRYFNEKYIGLRKEMFLFLYSLITLFAIQYMPYIRGGIFWYSAMINYTFPYGLTMAIFVWIDKFLNGKKYRYLVFLTLAFSFLGGSGYLAIVLNFEILALVIVYQLIKKDRCKRKKALLLGIPFILLLIGFAVSAMSPGNAIRGGEGYGFDISTVILTLKECIVQGLAAVPKTLWEVKVILFTLPLAVIGIWENLDLDKTKLKFQHPFITIAFLFLVSCSVYAPGIYSGDELSGGVYDTIYFVFILFFYLSVLYVVGYIKTRIDVKKNESRLIGSPQTVLRIRATVLFLTLMLGLIGGKYLLNGSAWDTCVDFIASGQLKDFEEQMQERLSILHDPSIKEVVLPEMNDQQGPFMHMPLTSDPKSYTNYATARFYGKDSVIAVPREEYEALQESGR